jgi:hypothetical protein
MLKEQGYLAGEIYRTAGSHGWADIIAVKPLNDGNKHRWAARLIQIKTCREKDLNKYKKMHMEGVETWIKVLNKGWEIIP